MAHRRLMYVTPSITMVKRTFLPLAAVFLFACSQQAPAPQVAAGIERIVEQVAISSGTPVTVADLSIEGMSCAMMCGGSIKKALAQLPGVTGTEINFIEGDENDHAVVTYDESKVTDAEMIEAIQKLHDGQYKVLAVKVTQQVKGATSASSEGTATEESKPVSVLSPAAMILPGILSLLTHFLRL